MVIKTLIANKWIPEFPGCLCGRCCAKAMLFACAEEELCPWPSLLLHLLSLSCILLPISASTATPRLNVCLACLSPGGLVALVMTTAFSGTLVVLSCPIQLMSPISGRNYTWAKSWVWVQLTLLSVWAPMLLWGKLVPVFEPNSGCHLAGPSHECTTLTAQPVLLSLQAPSLASKASFSSSPGWCWGGCISPTQTVNELLLRESPNERKTVPLAPCCEALNTVWGFAPALQKQQHSPYRPTIDILPLHIALQPH